MSVCSVCVCMWYIYLCVMCVCVFICVWWLDVYTCVYMCEYVVCVRIWGLYEVVFIFFVVLYLVNIKNVNSKCRVVIFFSFLWIFRMLFKVKS